MQICEILIPKEFTRLDNIVDIVFSAAEDASDETEQFENDEFTETPEPANSSQFKRTEKSVSFNEACALNFARLHNATLRKLSKTTYESKEKFLRIVSLVSKDYEN